MEDNQRVLTQNAMKGKKNIVGSLVKTAVLKAALSID
jgi:hypothetical protein